MKEFECFTRKPNKKCVMTHFCCFIESLTRIKDLSKSIKTQRVKGSN